MKTIILATISFLISLTLTAQNPAQDNPKTPDILFEDKVVDFGTVQEGDKVLIEFKFVNSGNLPLVIHSVKPGCGCTAEGYPKNPIMPGDSGIITASFRSKGYGGRNISKSMTVTTNIRKDGNEKRVVLIFKGIVTKVQ